MAGMSERAGVIRRLAASLYETLLLAALALVVGFALTPVLTAGPSLPALEHALPLLTPAAQALSFGCLFAAFGAYCAWGWSDGRRTLPMKTWRLTLVRIDRTAPDGRTALVRYFAGWIGPALALLGYVALRKAGHGTFALGLIAFNYLWAFADPDRCFLHDRLAGTRIVVEGPA